MADRIPLIVDSSTQQIKELPAGDSLILSDNEKVILGTDSDLQIYHDGSNSRIQEAGTGSLLVRGTNLQLQDSDGYDYITCTDGGNGGTVALKHLGTTVLSTTSTGIDVTGNATFDDSGKAIFGAGSDLEIYHDGSDSIINEAGTGVLKIRGSAGIYIQKYDGTENLASFLHDDGVYLYDGANNIRLQTTSTGVTVTGALLEDSNRVATNGRAIAFSLIFG